MSDEQAIIRLLQADPDLGSMLPHADMISATRRLVAKLSTLEAGRSYELNECCDSGNPVLLVVEGNAARRITTYGGSFIEILGAGDLLFPWSTAEGAVPDSEQILPLSPLKLVELNDYLFCRASRWPRLVANLILRGCERTRRLALQLAVTHMVRVDGRVLAVLWHFARRWGTVSGTGVTLPVPLNNYILAEIVGARVSSVSTAVASLIQQGLVERLEANGWFLRS